MKGKTVKDYMTPAKYLITFQPDTNIYYAMEMLVNRAISGAPVTMGNGDLVGILSEKDCLKVMIQIGMHDHPPGMVDEYMSKEVKTIDPDKSVLDAVEMFQQTSFRRFPVTEGKQLVGLLSRRDMLRAIKDMH